MLIFNLIIMNIRKIVASLLLAGLIFQSCSKLDNPPTDVIDPSKAFRNLDDLNLGVLGAYAALTTSLIESGAIVSDEVMYPTENTVSNNSAHRWLYNSTSGSVTSALYEYAVVIDRANRVLEAAPTIPAAGEQNRLDRYRAEALALRAYWYIELIRAYASSYEPNGMGMPYVKQRTLEYLPRESVKSNFDNLNADLQTAKELISSSLNDNTRITKTAIAAIQARAALYEKKWGDAITYASEVIAAEPLAPKSDFGKIWKDSSQSEVVWKLARVIGDSRLGAAFFRETGEIVLYAPSFKLIDLFGSNTQRADDVRFSSYIQYAPTRPAGKSQYLVNKYVGGNTAYRGLTDVKLFRAGEMYLIKAEAELENNTGAAGIAAAAKDLNDLRRARIYNYIDQNFTDKQSLLNAIYNERFKELAFEGHRFFDLKRRNLPVERTTQDAINTSGAIKLNPTAAQYCFPIPADEMAVNKGMIQNPNY